MANDPMGLQSAYGLHSLDQLLQQRMAQKLAAEKVAEDTRRFNVQSGEVERAHNLTRDWHQLQREQNAQNQANLQQGRQFEQANKIAEEAVPGDVLGQGGVAAMHAANLGGRILSTPQDPYEGVDVTQMGGPGVTQRPSKPTDTTGVLRAGSKWQTGEAQRANQLLIEREQTKAKELANEETNRPVDIINAQGKTVGSARKGSIHLPAPPQPALQLIQTNDAEGNPIQQFVPKTAGATFGKPQGQTMESRLQSAKAVVQTGEDLKQQIRANAANLGPAMGRFTSLEQMIGNPPSEVAGILGQIKSYAMANMGVHGMRSVLGAEHISQALGPHMTPEALIATIEGINGFANHLLENAGRKGGGGGGTRTLVKQQRNPETGQVRNVYSDGTMEAVK